MSASQLVPMQKKAAKLTSTMVVPRLNLHGENSSDFGDDDLGVDDERLDIRLDNISAMKTNPMSQDKG